MKKLLTITLVALVAAVPVAVVEADSEKVCPEGQALVSVKAGDTVLHNDKAPPPGAYFEDEVSGSGPDYTVRSDRNSASVEGDPVRLEIACD